MTSARALGLVPDIILPFQFCQVELYWDWQRVITRFPDGTEAHAAPHDTPEYRAHAIDKSGENNPMLYCLEHDLTHIIVGEAQDTTSQVLWAIAHEQPTEEKRFSLEEEAAQGLHRFFTASQWPVRCDQIRMAARLGLPT